jgi:CBS domain-containing protein
VLEVCDGQTGILRHHPSKAADLLIPPSSLNYLLSPARVLHASALSSFITKMCSVPEHFNFVTEKSALQGGAEVRAIKAWKRKLLGISMRVRSLLNARYPTLTRDSLVTRARSLMRDLGLRMIPVVEEGKVIGVVTRENVLSVTSTRSNVLVGDVMDSPRVVFEPSEDLWTALKVMLELDEWYVPVVSAGNIYEGVLEIDSFIRSALAEFADSQSLGPLRDYMTTNVEYVTPDDSIARLWRKMVKTKYAGFPVVRGDRDVKVIGVITQHDLLKKGYTRIELESESGPRSSIRVREAMTTPAITATESDSVYRVAEIMTRNNIGRIPVVDHRGSLVGIVDRSDVCRAYIRARSVRE